MADEPEETRADPVPDEPSTVDAPARWSGSAAVPAGGPRRPRWSRRRAVAEDEPDDRAMTPPVDPWEGQDTPWDPMPLPPSPDLPPTRLEPPPPPPPDPQRYRPAVTYPPPPPKYQRRVVQAPPDQRPLPPPPPRRRRRWPRNLAIITVLGALCCCGVPALFLVPVNGQYPVTAVLPDSISDLNRRDDAASVRAAQRLSAELSSADAFAAIYSDGNGKRVTIFGITGLRLTPKQDVEAQIAHLTPDYDIRDVRSYDLGVSGAHERCGIGRAGGSTVTVCAWADHGSLATVLMTRRSVADSAELTGVLRSAVLIRG